MISMDHMNGMNGGSSKNHSPAPALIEGIDEKSFSSLMPFKTGDNEDDDDVKDCLGYQVKRDLAMFSDPPNILLYYEELVKQFGYIVLFSNVFPLASLMSFISNGIQVTSQIKNLTYLRRFRAEPSNGLGSWMDCLENLCQYSIIANCMSVYLTSKVYA